MPHDPTAIRNVALVGHHGAGKTTLAEALLAATGSIARRGSVEKGTTVMDFEPEEVSRQLTISTSLAPFTVNGVKVNLLDTPGYADFAGEMLAALANVDLAVVVVSATDGVQAQTEDAWRAAARLGVPRVVVINKLDRERGDFDRTLVDIRQAFGAGVAPVELPIGHESDFHGVIDLLDDTATHYDTPAAGAPIDGTVPPAGHEGPIPEDLVDEEHEVHEQLVEGIVVGDDDLMERYLNGEALEYAELEKSLAGGVASASVFPVLCCSAASGVGVDRLARLIEELCPSPASRPPVLASAGTETAEIPCDPAGPTLLTVTKTFNDSHTGKMSLCKVLSGTLQPDAILVNSRTKEEERLHALQSIAGHATAPATAVTAGDFVAVPRLNGTRTGDTLAPKGQPVTVPPPDLPAPALQVAVKPATRADDDKLMSALQRLCDEDPSLTVTRDDETHQTILGVNGEVHLGVTLERLERKCNVHVEREDLRIAYRETITKPAAAEGKHKKQSGGHGQFGVCHLRLEPRGRGEGFAFIDAVVGGVIPRQYIPAVEKGVIETFASGGVHGFPVVDVAVTVDDGKAHSVDSNEVSFKMAAALAIKAAMPEAGPIVLEPVSRLEVTIPDECQGDIMGDLSARRAKIVGTDPADHEG
ncbi:MAG TPA: elongation factor G, partial [Acidimicrobiales bacterium]|nr:elongation factor G [Acidimicrobiales bacterium]